ncbi:hypothetical protein [Streptomyces caatingaensis]|uniref:hypothetical protein n=1 Tax=Streptomyces caatingaensis TaxID=1678637 RepID=UPI000672866E|nr:hypothetical protein [Streptomyces caatingaensis]
MQMAERQFATWRRGDEPTPVDGCDVCAALQKQREEARKRGDHSKVTDAHVEIARHPHGTTARAK